MNTIAKQEGEINALKLKIGNIEKDSSRIDEERLDLERYSRSFNLRLSGIKEDNDEQPEASINKAVTGVTAAGLVIN